MNSRWLFLIFDIFFLQSSTQCYLSGIHVYVLIRLTVDGLNDDTCDRIENKWPSELDKIMVIEKVLSSLISKGFVLGYRCLSLHSAISGYYIHTREYRKSNQKWTMKRNWQHWVHRTKNNKTSTPTNMCWTLLCAKKTINNVNKIHDNGRGNHEERYKEPACETTTMGRCV